MTKWVVSVDLGGTQIRALRTDLAGEKLARSQRATMAEGGSDAVLERIYEAVEEVVSGVESSEIVGIGIGAPGPIDQAGHLHDPPNLPGWKDFSLSKRLSDRFDVPAYAGNDANLAALGEYRFGAGQGVEDLIYMTISTGIGGGIVTGGKMLLGARGFAAEVGHQTLVADGPICGCGQPGHLEALASGPSIAREALKRLDAGEQSSITGEVTPEAVAEAARQGDQLALEVLHQAGFYIGLGLTNLIHILEPERVLLGGGVSQAGNLLLDPIRETVYNRVMSPVYRDVQIMSAALGEDVGLMGAVALVLSETQ